MRAVRKHGLSGALVASVALTGLIGGWALPDQARAQEETQEQTVVVSEYQEGDEVREVVVGIMQEMESLAVGLGLDVPSIPVNLIIRAVQAATPSLPETDTRDWGASIQFELTSGYVEPGNEAAQAGTPSDQPAGRECAPASMVNARVVDFHRFEQNGLRGDQCVLQGAEEDIWALHATTVAQGRQRRILATYGMAVLVDAEPQTSAALGEAYLDTNMALSKALTDYGLAMLETVETGVERDPLAALRQLGETLDAAAAAPSGPAADGSAQN